jgi:hypothetical protein
MQEKRKFKRIFVINEPYAPRINPALAVEIGLNESLVLMQIEYWISISDNVKDGRRWTYQSLRDIQKKAFPFWSVSTISRTIRSLLNKGYLIEGNYNKLSYDKTRWFALNFDELKKLKSISIPEDDTDLLQNETGLLQNETPDLLQNETTIPETTFIPETTTETTTYKELSTPKGTLDPIKKEKDYLFPSVKTEGIACENFSFPEEEYMFFDQYLKFYGGTKYFTPNAIEAAKYFTNTYRRVFKKLHPRDTKEGWGEILTGVLKIPLKSDTGEIYISENLFDFFELKEIIDLFFQQKFREPCNYSIRFFMQPGVKYRLFQKWQKEGN